MSKHTPGPWHVILSDNATPHVTHEHGYNFTDISDVSSRVCVMPAEITYSYNSLANARLIAAAPELLEALEEVVAVFESNPSSITDTVWVTGNRPETLYDHCRAAIAKAKGETK